MSHWDNQQNADHWKGTLTLMVRAVKKFVPPYISLRPIISCGTWSDPTLCPIDAEVINCLCERNQHNKQAPDGIWHCDELLNCFTFPAFSAALSYALLAKMPWDLLLWVYHKNTVIGTDLGPIVDQFMQRPESLLAPSIWLKDPDLSLSFWKPRAVQKYMNCRFRPNLVRHPDAPNPTLIFETEIGHIFKNDWWNPWPAITNFRLGPNDRVTREEYLKTRPVLLGGPQEWLNDWLVEKGLNQ